MNARPVALPVLLLQLACIGLLLIALFGRLMEVWETHISEPDQVNALTQLSMRLWVPATLLIGLAFAGINLGQAVAGRSRVGGNVLWPMLATLFLYFASAYATVIIFRLDGVFQNAGAVLDAQLELNPDRSAALAYKTEVPAFYNLAPGWMHLWIPLLASLAGFAGATISYWLEGHRGDLLEPEEEQAAFS